MEGSLPQLDMSSALILLGDAVSARVLDALAGTGLRHGHGYLMQRLLVGPMTASEMAEDLGVSQQAVSKSVKELVALGHVELGTDEADRRRRPVRLTERGAAAVETARASRRAVDAQIRASLGEDAFDATMAALRSAMGALGLDERVERRAVRPPADRLDQR